MIKFKKKIYNTNEEESAFRDGLQEGIKTVCKKYGIPEENIYKKEDIKEDVEEIKDKINEFVKQEIDE